MPCPILALLGLVATLAGACVLLFRDSRGRLATWLTLAVLLAGWLAYFLASRTPALRMALELATMLAVAAGAWRLWHLGRTVTLGPAFGPRTHRFVRATLSVVGSPGVLAAKVWLAAMLVMEWRGKAHFGALEYALVSVVIVALALERIGRLRRRSRFATLESFAGESPAAACPLGFGATRALAPARLEHD